MVSFLFRSQGKATVEVTDDDGMTPLLHAAALGKASLVEILLGRYRATVSVRCKAGMTAFKHSIRNHDKETQALLVRLTI
jgi:ankyrin repeat protein